MKMVSALSPVLPEATAEDLTQIVLTSSTLNELRSVNLQFRIPEEFKSLIPQLAPLLDYLPTKNAKAEVLVWTTLKRLVGHELEWFI
jgi:hypothetical protein